MKDRVLDAVDQRLIDALHVSPRASWAALAPVVGVDAVTLARRWSRLHEEGLAYITGMVPDTVGLLALVEASCAPGDTLAVADEFAADPCVFSVDLTAGGRDIVLAVGVADHAELSTWSLERVPAVSRLTQLRTLVISRVFADARSWRLRSLTGSEVEALQALAPRSPPRTPRLTLEEVAGLRKALVVDGRTPSSAIAEEIGVSPRTVRTAIAGMVASGTLVFRTDVARAFTPWPISVHYFLKVPAAMVDHVGAQLSQLQEVRMVASAVGEHNLVLVVWLRTLQDVGRLEAAVEKRLSGVRIADRSIVLRSRKHLGHLLDSEGRAVGGSVPWGYARARDM